jgi:hypothetical protein
MEHVDTANANSARRRARGTRGGHRRRNALALLALIAGAADY